MRIKIGQIGIAGAAGETANMSDNFTIIQARKIRSVQRNGLLSIQRTLASDYTVDNTIDFGFNTPCSGSIGDRVWHDLNRNGIQDAGEPGIQGAPVTLRNAAATVIATTYTDPSGGYLFSGLCAGNYTVEVTTPNGFVPSPSMQGSDQTIDFGFHKSSCWNPCSPCNDPCTNKWQYDYYPCSYFFQPCTSYSHPCGW